MSMDGQDNIFKAEDGTALRFFYDAAKNNFVSEAQGSPFFDKVLYVEVMTPGSSQGAPVFEVEREFCERANVDEPRRSPKYEQYKAQVEAFKRDDGTGNLAGMPINQWPEVDVSLAATLKGKGIYTVEQLAGVSDGNLNNMGHGARLLREKAQQYLNSREWGVPTAALTKEASELRDENAWLKDEVKSLSERLTTALAEVQALRTGQPAPSTPATVNPLAFDPFNPGQTQAQPDAGASMDPNSANALTPESAAEVTENRQAGKAPGAKPKPKTI